jgi:hypothetical protein
MKLCGVAEKWMYNNTPKKATKDAVHISNVPVDIMHANKTPARTSQPNDSFPFQRHAGDRLAVHLTKRAVKQLLPEEARSKLSW